MKVLILPSNIASMPAITLDRLTKSGIEARAIFIDTNIYQDNTGAKIYPLKGLKYGFLHKLFNATRFYINVVDSIVWADIIHWSGAFSFPMLYIILPIVKLFKRPALVEWVGSDIRIPEVEFKDNPYYKKVYFEGYEYKYESLKHSLKVQKLFKWAGFKPLVFPGMEQYIIESEFDFYYNYIQRIDVAKYNAVFPDPNRLRPVIVHAPTAPHAKGTFYLEKAIAELKEDFDFEYKIAHKISREETLKLIASCDIFVDQLILGSYGMAAMEGFAFGKPVVCYMKASVLNCFPGKSPIVNANPDTIKEVLSELLMNRKLRNDKGIESRNYVEKYHNIDSTIEKLIAIYEAEINRKNKSNLIVK